MTPHAPAATGHQTRESVGDHFAAAPRDLPAAASYMACHSCGATGPVAASDTAALFGDWHGEHTAATGHNDYDVWTLTRARARIANR